MKNLFLFLFAMSLVISCKTKTDTEDNQSSYTNISVDSTYAKQAFEKMQTLCYVCHHPETAMENRIAPPMLAVKMHYSKKYSTEKEFVEGVWDFVKKPEDHKALMKGAVKKFNLMPYQPYKEEDIKAIAGYMFNYELEKPSWFDTHLNAQGKGEFKQKGTKLQHKKRKGPKQNGMNMALATKKELGKNLMKAINEKGAAAAVDFCHIKAIPITSEMEKAYNATIKRASDKPRNPNNKATVEEENIIDTYKSKVANAEDVEPVLKKNKGQFDFYYPITTNDMCLKCHGKVKDDIQPDTYKAITLKYPEDLAVGYDVNEVRGVWHIQFQKE